MVMYFYYKLSKREVFFNFAILPLLKFGIYVLVISKISNLSAKQFNLNKLLFNFSLDLDLSIT